MDHFTDWIAIDPKGGVYATPFGGVYNKVWTRDTFFSLLGVETPAIEYKKFATRLWRARNPHTNHIPYIFGRTFVPFSSGAQFNDEKTHTPVADSNALYVLAAVCGNTRNPQNAKAALAWYDSLRRIPGSPLVYEGAAASWEDSLKEPSHPVAYTNALVYAATLKTTETEATPAYRQAVKDLVVEYPCAVAIGVLVEWGGFDKGEFDNEIGKLRSTGNENKGFQAHSLDSARAPLGIMQLFNMGGYHTEAFWPWTQLFLAGCLSDKEMGRPWLEVFQKTNKLFETYQLAKNQQRPTKFWWLASSQFAMGLGCLSFYMNRTSQKFAAPASWSRGRKF